MKKLLITLLATTIVAVSFGQNTVHLAVSGGSGLISPFLVSGLPDSLAALRTTVNTKLEKTSNLSDLSSASTARTNLGGTTVGSNLFTLANPSAVRFIKINADNTTTARTAAEMLSDIGGQASGSYAVTTNNLSDLSNAATSRNNLGATTVGANIFTLSNPSATGYVRTNADNTVTHRTYANVKTDLSLDNVDNTSDATKNAASVTLTNKTISFANNTIQAMPVTLVVAASDESTAITTGTAKITFRMPHAMTLSSIRGSLTTVSSSGLVTINVKENGTTVFSTQLTIDASEKTSTTAATAAVLSDTVLADDAEITIDIVGAGTNAAGLKITFIGTR